MKRRPPRSTHFPSTTLFRSAFRATGDVSKIGKGRHTSSSVVLFDLPGGGMVIDTPGIRSFRLAHVTADDVLAARAEDRKSTRLNSSHANTSDAVFCLTTNHY